MFLLSYLLKNVIICLVSGSAIQIPLPIIASNPHFLDADRSIQDAVIGLLPDEILHRSYMDIEPTTGSKALKMKIIKN
jgi:hypothetical protein